MRCLCPQGTLPEYETLSCVPQKQTLQTQMPNRFVFPPLQSTTPPFAFTASLTNNVNQQPSYMFPQQSLVPQPSTTTISSASPGSSCANGEQCGGGSLCTYPLLICLCPGELEDYGGECVVPPSRRDNLKASPGSSCANGEQCGGGSLCTYPLLICLCPGELEDYGGECVVPPSRRDNLKGTIGSICRQHLDCGSNSVCIDERCICVKPFVEYNGACVISDLSRAEVGPGEQCANGEICTRGSICDPTIPVCICPSETELRGDSCIPITAFSNFPPMMTTIAPSTATIDYYSFTFPSVSQSFTTKPNLMKVHYGGNKHAEVGAQCSVNTDCMIGAYCKGNTNPPTCQCLSTHVNVNSRCEKVYYPGQKGCDYDLQCSIAYAGAQCVHHQCVCPQGFKAIEQTCHSGFAYAGSPCDSSLGVDACSAQFVCIASRCQCPPPLVEFQRQCVNKTDIRLNASNIRHKCKSADECPPDLKCLDGKCDCPPGMMRENTLCKKPKRSNLTLVEGVEPFRRRFRLWKRSLPNNTRKQYRKSSLECWPDQHSCADGKGICLEDVCHCINGYVRVDDECKPEILPLNSSCDTKSSSQCGPNAECIDGVCICTESNGCGQDRKRGTGIQSAIRTLSLGASCTSANMCPKGMLCLKSTCQCAKGFLLQDGQCKKMSGTFKPINSQCSEEDRCMGGSVCSSSICSCIDGSVEAFGRCRQRPGGRCANGETCAGDSVCELAVCRCPDGYRLEESGCVASIAMPGKSCHMGQKCANGSQCRFGVCMCAANYRIVGNRCERLSNIIAGATQSRTTSTTTAPFRTRSARVVAVKPGQMCMDGEMCLGGSTCASGFCVCAEGELIINDECVGSQNKATQVIKKGVKAAPGQFCNDETSCIGGSICLASMCTCPEGTRLTYGECIAETTALSIEYTTEANVAERRMVGSVCRMNSECPFRTECVRGICRCKQGETFVDGTCRKAVYEVRPGGNCNPLKGLDCVGESYCIYGVCVCIGGLVNTGFECASAVNGKAANPGQSCAEGQICTGGSKCTGRICECSMIEVINESGHCILPAEPLYTSSEGPSAKQTPHYASYNTMPPNINEQNENEGKHKMTQYLNASHMTIAVLDKDAFRALFGTQIANNLCEVTSCSIKPTCANGSCTSTNDGNFSPIVNVNEKLQPSLSHNPWQTVLTPSVVTAPTPTQGGTFTNNFLLSTQTPFFDFRTGVPGEGCTPQGLCSNGAFCVNFLCTCTDGYAVMNGKCLPRSVALHVECEVDLQCPRNAYCTEGFCVCRPSYLEKQGSCVVDEGARPGEDCSSGRICGYSSYCSSASGVCECTAGMATSKGECHPAIAPLGPVCITSANCDRTSYCDNGYCLCKSGYFWDGHCCVAVSQFNSDELSAESSSLTDPKHQLASLSNELFPILPFENSARVDDGQSPISTFRNEQGPQPSFTDNSGRGFYKQNGIQNIAGINPLPMRKLSWQPVAGTANADSFIDSAHQHLTPLKSASLDSNTIDDHRMASISRTNVADLSSMSLPFQPESEDYFHAIDGHEVWDESPWKLQSQSLGMTGGGDPTLPMFSPHLQQFPQPPTNMIPVPLGSPSQLPIQPPPQILLGPSPQLLLPNVNSQLFPLQNPLPVRAEGMVPSYYLGAGSFPFRAFRASPMRAVTTLNNSTHVKQKKTYNKYEQVAMPGEFCGEHQMCLGNSICKFDWCRCREGHILGNGICVQAISEIVQTVNDGNTDAIVPTKRIARPFESCANFEECLAGSSCSNIPGYGLVCLCPQNNFFIDDKCQKPPHDVNIAFVGEICDSSTICVDGGECDFGICVCADGKTNVSSHCAIVASPGESCGQGQLCVGNSVCAEMARICVCPAGTRMLFGRCVEARSNPKTNKVLPGMNCDSINEVCLTDSYCSEKKICECNEEFMAYNGKCIRRELIRWPGERCNEETFCDERSFCDDGICKCLNGNIAIDKSCNSIAKKIRRIPFRGMFNRRRITTKRTKKSLPNEMSKEVNRCKHGICSCDNRFIAINQTCTRLRLPGEQCERKDFCGYGASCVDGYCICDQHTTLKVGKCVAWHSSNPGASCLNKTYCNGGSICLNGWCVCEQGYYPDSSTDRCYDLRRKSLNSSLHYNDSASCYERLSCDHRNRSCTNDNGCNSREDGRSTSPPGGSCYEAQECTGGSVCRDGWCVCPESSMIVMKGICVDSQTRQAIDLVTLATVRPIIELKWITSNPSIQELTTRLPLSVTTGTPFASRKAVPGSNCGPLDECVGGSLCIEGVCICPAGYASSDLTARCEPKSSISLSTPTPGVICLCPVEKPLIIDNKCTKHGTLLNARIATPGQPCDAATECTDDSV
uniref:EGF-like domain-containing protein n=1 Tax=Ascaris lumbricoides TaxID=6252 RepID=A0A0M3IGY1_ASCLU